MKVVPMSLKDQRVRRPPPQGFVDGSLVGFLAGILTAVIVAALLA